MIATLKTILVDNWAWRSQVVKLARFELKKKTHGTVLGAAWLFIKPAMYLFCFWFALEIGLRASRMGDGDAPFLLWLMSGIFPWFFMSQMISSGTDALAKHKYLVQKVRFPLSCISSLFVLSVFFIQLVLQAALLIAYFLFGQPLDVHLLQVPVLLIVLFVFWDLVSIAFSQISALSRDFAQLMKALSTPFFWLSGVLFNINAITVEPIRNALLFNPITFFTAAFRDAYYYRIWVWEDPKALICFAVVFVVTLVFALLIVKNLHREVPDVI